MAEVTAKQPSGWAQFGQALLGALPIVGPMAAQYFQGRAERRNVLEQQRLTREANLELARYQYSKDLEMWNKANDYNSPISQMQRFDAAGLNPNLVYGQGSTGNAAQTMPKYQAPTVQYDAPVGVDLPAMLGMYQDFRMKQAQIKNAEFEAEYNRLSYWERAQMQRDKMITGRMDLNYWRTGDNRQKLLESQKDYASGRVRQMLLQGAKTEAETRYKNKQTDWMVESIIGDWIIKILGMIPQGKYGRLGGSAPKRTPSGMAAPKSSARALPQRGIDKSNKAWQKEFESHSQWMRRVNPGAN